MKLRLNYVWLALQATPLLFYACKNDTRQIDPDKTVIADVSPAEDSFVLKARNFYTDKIAAGKTETENTRSRSVEPFGTPVWELTERIPEDTSILRVPMSNYSFTGSGYANFLFKTNTSGNMTGVIVQVIFEPGYLDKKVLEYKKNKCLLVPLQQDFSGVISHWDINGNFLGGRSWQNGTISSDFDASLQTSSTDSHTSSNNPANDGPDWEENPPPGNGSVERIWVTALPGVTIKPNPGIPLPGWTFSSVAGSFPPGEPKDKHVISFAEAVPGLGNPFSVTEGFSLIPELIDMINGGVSTCPVFVSATKTLNENHSSISFKILIDIIKEKSKRQGLVITDADIAGKLGTTALLFATYYRDGNAPDEIIARVFKQYDHILEEDIKVETIYMTNVIYPPEPYVPPVRSNE